LSKEDKIEKDWIKTDIKAPPTIRETIHQHIKDAIIKGQLKPGQRITEREIAKIFNVSSGPVREAFQKLSAEKFITIDARKEVHVAYSTLDEIKELVEFVINLDSIAVKRALRRMDNEDIDDFKEMTKKLGDFLKEKDALAFSKQNMQIHEKIWELSGNSYLCQALAFHYEKLIILVNYFIFSRKPPALSTSYKGHIDLLEVLEQKDLKKVDKVITNHWNWILKYLT